MSNIQNIIGMDLDGVIAGATMKYTEGGIYKKYKTCVLLLDTPHDKTIIITGRKPRFKGITKNWLKENNVNYSKIIFYKGKKKKFEQLADYKAKKIKKHNITTYIEDTPEIAVRIQEKVPECKVILFYNYNLYTLNKIG